MSRKFENGFRGPLYNRTLNKERGRDYRRRSFTPASRERMWDSCSRSPSPHYPRRRNRYDSLISNGHENNLLTGREQFHRLDDYQDHSYLKGRRVDQRHSGYMSFDSDYRDRSRSPLSSRDYNNIPVRYDDSPIYGRFNSLDCEILGDYRECTSHRGENNVMRRESTFGKQRRKLKTKNRANHSRESESFSRSLKIPHHPLLICKFYNNEGTCKNKACVYLHVCKYYINDDCKFGTGCMRSHNVLEEQPRSILEKYDMVPRYYSKYDQRHVRKITLRVKEKLAISVRAFGVNLDDNQAAKNRTIDLLDRVSDNEISSDDDRQENIDRTFRRTMSLSTDSSNESSLEDTNGQIKTHSEDYIPLEEKAAADTITINKKKRMKLESKTKMHRHRGKKIKSEYGATLSETRDKGSPDHIQSAMTFNHTCGNFQASKINDHWHISTMGDDDWSDFNQDVDKMMEDLCSRATKVKEIFDKMTKEQKL